MLRKVDDIAEFTELGDYLEDTAAHVFGGYAGAGGARGGDQHRPGDSDPG